MKNNKKIEQKIRAIYTLFTIHNFCKQYEKIIYYPFLWMKINVHLQHVLCMRFMYQVALFYSSIYNSVVL